MGGWLLRGLMQFGLVGWGNEGWFKENFFLSLSTLLCFLGCHWWMIKRWSYLARICTAVMAFVCWMQVWH